MPDDDRHEKRIKEDEVNGLIPVAFINGNTGQPFDTKEDFFKAIRNLVATKREGETE